MTPDILQQRLLWLLYASNAQIECLFCHGRGHLCHSRWKFTHARRSQSDRAGTPSQLHMLLYIYVHWCVCNNKSTRI